MKKFYKLFLILLFILIFPFFATKSIASNDFKTAFNVTYQIDSNGLTHAIFNGELINQKDGIYASSYYIKVGYTDLTNVRVSDGAGAISANLSRLSNQTEISFPFNQQVVGNGKILNFTISFDTQQAASHVGNIWEVNLPGFQNQSNFENFNVHLIVPPQFGALAYVKPNIPFSNGLNFSKSDLGNSGISLAFGNLQSFDFKLNYNLKNTNLFPIRTEIALPPDTNYQKVEINSLSVKPINVVEDIDGNWLAKYYLLPKQKETITATGNVLIYLNPKKQILSDKDRQIYLKPQQYWESNNPEIENLAKTLKTPRAIFDYVVSHLSYNFVRANSNVSERFGAAAILNNPTQAVCLEFSDLFIAIARSAGIPAREIEGYAYTENSSQRPTSLYKDILHAWPEYYNDNRQTWIQVDPTWQNTTGGVDYFNTFDFDHFAFVINGNSSTYPIPAGGYKFVNSDSKDVFVSFSNITAHPVGQITTKIGLTSSDIFSHNLIADLVINNTGNVAFSPVLINISGNNLIFNPNNFISNTIPPLGEISYQLSARNYNSLTTNAALVKIQAGDFSFQKTIKIIPIYLIGGIIFAGIFIYIIFKITLFAWSLFISK